MKILNILLILFLTRFYSCFTEANADLIVSDNTYCKGCEKWVTTFSNDTGLVHWQWVLPNASWSFASNSDSSSVLLNIGTTGGILKVRSMYSGGCYGIYRTLNVSVTNTVTPTIHITVNTTTHKFSQTHTNAGGSPVYLWVKNGLPMATTLNWTDNNWTLGSIIGCSMISSVKCVTENPVYSNQITE